VDGVVTERYVFALSGMLPRGSRTARTRVDRTLRVGGSVPHRRPGVEQGRRDLRPRHHRRGSGACATCSRRTATVVRSLTYERSQRPRRQRAFVRARARLRARRHRPADRAGAARLAPLRPRTACSWRSTRAATAPGCTCTCMRRGAALPSPIPLACARREGLGRLLDLRPVRRRRGRLRLGQAGTGHHVPRARRARAPRRTSASASRRASSPAAAKLLGNGGNFGVGFSSEPPTSRARR